MPSGRLIGAGVPECDGYEVAYIGVVPEMRRRGYARETILRFLAELRVRRAKQVTITVDKRNQPALRLYTGLGLEEFDRREVYLRL